MLLSRTRRKAKLALKGLIFDKATKNEQLPYDTHVALLVES
jgi:hypothetical protein